MIIMTRRLFGSQMVMRYDCESPAISTLLTRDSYSVSRGQLFLLCCLFICWTLARSGAVCVVYRLLKYYRFRASVFTRKLDNRYGNCAGGTSTLCAITFLPIDLTSPRNFNEF